MKIPSIRFTANLKNYLILSGLLMAVIIVFMFVFGVRLDIQFKGGSIITYSYEGDLDSDSFAAAVGEIVGTDVSLQRSESLSTGQQTVVVSMPGNQSLSSDKISELNESVMAAYSANNLQTLNIDNVNPVMGREFLSKSLLAITVASILMVVYVAFRFQRIGGLSAGAMAVVALIHDVIIVFGVFVIFRIPINDNFIAVVLTILGFSLNDTIVIYDRIRENDKLIGKSMSLSEQVDLSINQSFKRSIIISVTAVMAMIVVSVVALIYNVDSIMSFSFPLIIGLVSGSYSTFCLAGPLWVKWKEHKAETN